MLAISGWTWIVAVVLALGAFGVLAGATLGLIRRLKDLNGTLRETSGNLNEAMDQMRGDLERISEGMETLRRKREEAAGPG